MVLAVISLPSLARGMASLARTASIAATELGGALSAARSLSDIPRILAQQGRAVALALSIEGGITISAICVQYPRITAAVRSAALRLLPIAEQAIAGTRAGLAQMVTELKCGMILAIEEVAPGATGKLARAGALPEAAKAATWSRATAEALIEAERGATNLLSNEASKGAVHVPPAGVDPLQNVGRRLVDQPNIKINTGYRHARHAAVDLRDCLNKNAERIAQLRDADPPLKLTGATAEPRIAHERWERSEAEQCARLLLRPTSPPAGPSAAPRPRGRRRSSP